MVTCLTEDCVAALVAATIAMAAGNTGAGCWGATGGGTAAVGTAGGIG